MEDTPSDYAGGWVTLISGESGGMALPCFPGEQPPFSQFDQQGRL
jgi:hypothetical protein